MQRCLIRGCRFKMRSHTVCASLLVLCVFRQLATQFSWAAARSIPQRSNGLPYNSIATAHSRPLPVFWIEQSATRAQGMQSTFAALAGRVHATRVPQVNETNAASQLAFAANTTLIPSDEHGHSRCQLNGSHVSRLISHLVAIRLAYTEGHDLVLVMEDDAVLDNQALSRGMSMITSAPEDWQILQLSMDNNRTVYYGRQLSDVWISWMPDHTGTASYFINQQGMRSILEQHTGGRGGVPHGQRTTAIGANMPAAMWQIHELCMLFADEFLYYFSTTYTAARPVVPRASMLASSAAPSTTPGALLRAPDQIGDAPGPLAGAVLVVQSSSVFGEDELALELSRIRTDAVALKRCHTRSEWRVHLVVTPGSVSVDESRLQDLAMLGVKCYVERGVVGRYNKYRFVAPHVEEFVHWDYVLLKDSDMRISGFPWRTFFAKKGTGVIAGPIRQSLEEGLLRNEQPDADAIKHEQWFQIHQAHRWKRFAPNFIANVKVQEVPFLEMYFTLFDSKFANFFFHDILSAAFVQGSSAWGPDLMWCTAAVEWVFFAGGSSIATPRKGCVLVPVVAHHEDSRTIAKNQGDEKFAPKSVEGQPSSRAMDNARALKRFSDNMRHARWMQGSLDYRNRFGGRSNKSGMLRFFRELHAGRRFVTV